MADDVFIVKNQYTQECLTINYSGELEISVESLPIGFDSLEIAYIYKNIAQTKFFNTNFSIFKRHRGNCTNIYSKINYSVNFG